MFDLLRNVVKRMNRGLRLNRRQAYIGNGYVGRWSKERWDKIEWFRFNLCNAYGSCTQRPGINRNLSKMLKKASIDTHHTRISHKL